LTVPFFGFETDTALAVYLFTVIDRAVGTEAAAFRQLNPHFRGVHLRQASASFQHGVVARVSERLDAMHRARDATVRAQRSTGTALILAKDRVVEDAFRETDVRLVSMNATGRRVISTAFRAGWAAGERVNLNRPVPGDATRLSGPRDRQRRRVCAWEDRVVAPCDPTILSYPDAQTAVDAIWLDMGLRYPPAVGRLSPQASATIARADRLSILLADRTPSWCVLHELAHAMTSHADGRSDGHGPVFVGVYVRLIERYLRLDPQMLIDSLWDAGIDIARNAQPVFVDP
jgi:hypothetical protein